MLTWDSLWNEYSYPDPRVGHVSLLAAQKQLPVLSSQSHHLLTSFTFHAGLHEKSYKTYQDGFGVFSISLGMNNEF